MPVPIKMVILLVSLNIFHSNAQDVISGKYTKAGLAKILIPSAQWTPFPKPSDKAGWSMADQETLKGLSNSCTWNIKGIIKNEATIFTVSTYLQGA